MPGIHGPELAALLRDDRPDIGVVYMSGHAEDAISRSGSSAAAWGFLAKPFKVKELLAVSRAFDANARKREQPLAE